MIMIKTLEKRIETLEGQNGKGDIHNLRIEWEDGTEVVTWEMRGEAFVRIVGE